MEDSSSWLKANAMEDNDGLKCPKNHTFNLINSLITFSNRMGVYSPSVQVQQCYNVRDGFTNANVAPPQKKNKQTLAVFKLL